MRNIDITTLSTCSAACWQAREEVCRCSCGGANHGCLRHLGAEQPIRTRRAGAKWYELAAVGVRPQLQAADRHYYQYRAAHDYGNHHVITSAATPQQVATWPELTAYRANVSTPTGPWQDRAYLVWIERGYEYRPGETHEHVGKYGLTGRSAAMRRVANTA